MVSTFAIDGAIQTKICLCSIAKAGEGITLLILSGDMNDIIGIKKSIENLGLVTDGVSQTVKHEIKRYRKGL